MVMRWSLMWPMKQSNYHLLYLTIIILSELYFGITTWPINYNNVTEYANGICMSLTAAITILQISYFYSNWPLLNQIGDCVTKFHTRSILDPTEFMSEKYLLMALRLNTSFYLFGVLPAGGFSLFKYLLDGVFIPPFKVWYPVIESTPTYFMLLLSQVMAQLFAASSFVNIVNLYATIIVLLWNQFHILGENLRNLVRISLTRIGIDRASITDRKFNTYLSSPEFHVQLKQDLGECIKHHQELLEICELFENLMSPILFAKISFDIIYICIIGFVFKTVSLQERLR